MYVGKKENMDFFSFLFWREIQIPRKVVSLNDLDRVVQLARRGTLNKKWRQYHKNVPDG